MNVLTFFSWPLEKLHKQYLFTFYLIKYYSSFAQAACGCFYWSVVQREQPHAPPHNYATQHPRPAQPCGTDIQPAGRAEAGHNAVPLRGYPVRPGARGRQPALPRAGHSGAHRLWTGQGGPAKCKFYVFSKLLLTTLFIQSSQGMSSGLYIIKNN